MFGKHAYNLAVSSTKSMHGHPLGAGGGIEAVACIKAMEENWVPPTIGLDEADADCDLDYVPNVGRDKKVTYAMSNSFAFGGLNAVLVFGPAAGLNPHPSSRRSHRATRRRRAGTQPLPSSLSSRCLSPGSSMPRTPVCADSWIPGQVPG